MKVLALKKLSQHLPLILVIVISVIICITNYQPGTWLSGWDTLQPEFNLGLYAQRVLFGAWQEHQGLGAPASQAHLAELPRLPILYLLQLVLPISATRYVFIFLMYILGGIGTYIFIRYSWFKKQNNVIYAWAAAIGSLFYLLNLGTLQHFYVPLEMFAVHYATIGFVLWSLHRYIEEPNRKNLALFFIIQIFTAPTAHTATLFYAYMGLVGLYAFILSLLRYKHQVNRSFQTLFFLALVVIAAHSYWLLPNLYYVTQHSQYVSAAKISRNFSAEAFWQNQAYGSLNNVIIFRNFLFNWKDFNFENLSFVDLFDEWRDHLSSGLGYLIYYILAICALIGLCLSFKSKTKSLSFALLALFISSLFFLVNLNFPFTTLFTVIQQSTLLKEALRFPFTKFSILFMLVMSVYLAHLVSFLLEFFQQQISIWDRKIFSSSLILVLAITLLYAGKPALQGNLISSNMKVQIPAEYQEAFEFMASQPSQGRIMKLPLTTYWGWIYQNWPGTSAGGYQGAGFTWFGFTQPTMDREFDRWANTNEFFYQEVSLAMRDKNYLQIAQLLEKYDVSYLLMDSSSLNTEVKGLKSDVILAQEMVKQLDLNPVWESGSLSIFRFKESNSFLYTPASYQPLVTDITSRRLDLPYNSVGNYTLAHDSNSLLFPLSDLLAERVNDVEYYQEEFKISKHFSPETKATNLVQNHTKYITLPVEISYQNQVININFPYSYKLQTNTQIFNLPKLLPISVQTPTNIQNLVLNLGENQLSLKPNQTITAAVTFDITKPGENYYFDSNQVVDEEGELVISDTQTYPIELDQDLLSLFSLNLPVDDSVITDITFTSQSKSIPIVISQSQAYNCDDKSSGKVVKVNHPDSSVTYEADNYGISCDSAAFSLLNHQSYLLHIRGENIKGRSLKIAIRDQVNNRVVLEELLPEGQFDETFSFSTPQVSTFQFTLGWETRSFGQFSSNRIEKIELYPVPTEYLAGIHLTANQPVINNQAVLSQHHRYASFLYSATVASSKENGLLVLSQTYDPLWIAFIDFPTRRLHHTIYNGWANAWLIPEGEHQIKIIYIPQLLAFSGMTLLLFTTLVFLIPHSILRKFILHSS